MLIAEPKEMRDNPNCYTYDLKRHKLVPAEEATETERKAIEEYNKALEEIE